MIGAQPLGWAAPGQGEVPVGQTLDAPFVASTTSVFVPTLSATGAASLTVPHISDATVLYPPTFGYQFDLPFISSTTTLYAPSVGFVISAPFISSSTTLFSPSLVLRMAMPFVTSTTTLFAPTLIYSTTLPFITSTTFLFIPTVRRAFASLTTSIPGANNDLTYTAWSGGMYGNGISVTYVVSGLSTALSVEVVGNEIIVHVATNGAGAPTSTASQVKAAVEAAASAFLVSVALAAGNDGSGIVAALGQTFLSGPGRDDSRVYIDGVELVGGSSSAISGSSTRRLNRPSQAQIRVPNHLAVGGVGSTLKIVLNGSLHHHGRVMLCETNPQEDTGYTVYNSTDPMELWQWRPARDYGGDTPGNFIDPSFLIRKKSGPQIMQEIFLASENPALVGNTEDGSAAEGPLFMSFGGFASGGVDLSGAPVTWPMTIAEVAELLMSTGRLDCVLTPIESGANMAQVDCYNGNHGTDRSGSVLFEYGMGAHNVRDLRWNEDLSNVTNKLYYNLGPKETIRRYKANIQGSDPCLDDPVAYNQATIEARRLASRSSYGVRMEIQEIEVGDLLNERNGAGVNYCVGGTYSNQDPSRLLLRRQWQLESYIRAVPRTLIHVTPIRGAGINAFDIGDLVRVRCTPSIRGGFDGTQRIYEYTVSWDEDSVLALSELQVSSDAEF